MGDPKDDDEESAIQGGGQLAHHRQRHCWQAQQHRSREAQGSHRKPLVVGIDKFRPNMLKRLPPVALPKLSS